MNSLGWAERHGNRAGVADTLARREGGVPGQGQDQAQSYSKQKRGRTDWVGAKGLKLEGERPETGRKLVRGARGGPGPGPGPRQRARAATNLKTPTKLTQRTGVRDQGSQGAVPGDLQCRTQLCAWTAWGLG